MKFRRLFVCALAALLVLSGAAPARTAVLAFTITPSPNGNYLIMPLGDSFAAGQSADTANGNNGYRAYLNTDLYGPNETHNFQWVGSQVSGTAGLHHEGHGGWAIADIANLVAGGALANPAPANSGPPQIVILTIGSNDFGLNHTWSQVLSDESALIDQILAVSPNLAIVVTEQILQSGNISHQLTDNSRRQQAYNANLPGMIATKPAGRVLLAHTSHIPQQDLDSSGVHCNDTGYRKFEWHVYQALGPLLGWSDGAGGSWMVNKVTPYPDRAVS